ncbi:hypothetical protein Cylst_5671 [Cylindrospermum stagnale PCC 7417]|uniref:Uncharacterized protein n=1 Tax=Cylindrospermum stagnale PCC 7417 TaxID=56107 RepID=K9X6G9_9NOST|nr:hypothetical protein Cylst_5671 [Cylindrospermum stagnale PCC 7417]
MLLLTCIDLSFSDFLRLVNCIFSNSKIGHMKNSQSVNKSIMANIQEIYGIQIKGLPAYLYILVCQLKYEYFYSLTPKAS